MAMVMAATVRTAVKYQILADTVDRRSRRKADRLQPLGALVRRRASWVSGRLAAASVRFPRIRVDIAVASSGLVR